MSVGINIENELVSGKKVARLSGRLDANTAPQLEEKLLEILGTDNAIALDFAQVTYLSSAGMRLLLAFTKKLRSMEGALILFSMQEDVMEIVRMAGFEKILHLFNTEAEALSAL